ncbi:hypothetical protein CB0940_04003 [Cercospora beticola]|uniref:Uncharacterized protein n=1 Tax=Cercospora beticola TaxID=122368 RepID=A0A2G5HMH9_CERBT|nr:hypothetical protein CB0940_04003 [Cercospora beticola]PIA93698.1 hypothetical protein CB0940_04003 [Cercospora beticola]WPB01212.1 hypothetical protein RHO25_005835 [Cercospora beticola]CAK1364031.1 unnamed protein product [Cercospora beticola]
MEEDDRAPSSPRAGDSFEDDAGAPVMSSPGGVDMDDGDKAPGSPRTGDRFEDDAGAPVVSSPGGMDMDDLEWTFPSPSVFHLPATSLTLRDDAIMCACPSEVRRDTKDIAKIQTGSTFTWIHVPCKPLLAQVSEASTAMANMILDRAAQSTGDTDDMQTLPEKLLATTLGPNKTQQQLQKVRNLTSTFRCDGPCRGSTDYNDYYWCQECYGWQHKPCMLFGDGDVGRPVCNVCYNNAMAHKEEIERWQKKRLAQAGLEALRFIRDPENADNEAGLAFARNFLGSLVSKNRNNFLQFVVNRRRVIRWLKARRDLKQPTYGNATRLPAIEGNPDEVYDPAALFAPAAPRRRKRRASVGSAATGEDHDEHSDFEDTIVVGSAKAARKKTASRKAKAKPAAPLEPLVSELTAEDEARNEMMRKIAERKARKKAAASAAVGAEDSPGEPPAKRARRATLPQQNEFNAGDEDFSDLGINTSRQTSRAPRKSAPSAGWSRGFDDEEPEPAPKTRAKGKGKQRQAIEIDSADEEEQPARRPSRSRAQRGDAGQERRQNEQSKIMCSCIDVAPDSNRFKCRGCDFYQHVACAPVQSKKEKLCKLCVGSGVVARPPSDALTSTEARPLSSRFSGAPGSSTLRAPSLAGPPMIQAEPKNEPLGADMQGEVRTLCSTVLWNAYCALQDPNDPSDHMNTNRAKTAPSSDWSAEAEKRLTLIFEAAGKGKVEEYLVHALGFPRNQVNIMKALRDFGMWARSSGPFRRSRKDLGLLNEILGFVDKGTYWQEKDEA